MNDVPPETDLTYLEQYEPAWVAEVLALAVIVGETDAAPLAA